MAVINEIIHQPIRLRIMAFLATFPTKTQITFSSMKRTLALTDGNLGSHLHKLEEAGYIEIIKAFVNNKPQTFVEITEKGQKAFAEHSAALLEILGKQEE